MTEQREGAGTDVTVRNEEYDDQAAVAALHRAAFGDHGEVVARLVEALRPHRG